jgi:hypothetical protein
MPMHANRRLLQILREEIGEIGKRSSLTISAISIALRCGVRGNGVVHRTAARGLC